MPSNLLFDEWCEWAWVMGRGGMCIYDCHFTHSGPVLMDLSHADNRNVAIEGCIFNVWLARLDADLEKP